jgi:hypothetical protein
MGLSVADGSSSLPAVLCGGVIMLAGLLAWTGFGALLHQASARKEACLLAVAVGGL